MHRTHCMLWPAVRHHFSDSHNTDGSLQFASKDALAKNITDKEQTQQALLQFPHLPHGL